MKKIMVQNNNLLEFEILLKYIFKMSKYVFKMSN